MSSSTFMPLTVEANGTHLSITNKSGDKIYDTSVANAILRASVNTSLTYALDEELHDKQIIAINNAFGTDFHPEHRLYCVTNTNFNNIQVLAQRINLIPVQLNDVTREYLENQQLYFTFTKNDDYKTPYLHNEPGIKRVYAHDLKVVKATGGDAGEDEESKTTIEPIEESIIRQIFPYNTFLFNMTRGDKIHIITQATANYGWEHACYKPCPFRYRFVTNSTHHKPNQRELEYTRNTDAVLGSCDNPDQIKITLEYNGKKEPKLALTDGLEYLINQVLYFKQEYHNPSSNVIKHEESGISNMQILSIYHPTEESNYLNHNGHEIAIEYMSDLTIVNMIALQLLYKVLNMNEELAAGDEDKFMHYLEQTCINGLKPHPRPRVMKCIINVQIPADPEFLGDLDVFTKIESLIDDVCDELVDYLSKQLTHIREWTPGSD